MAQHRTTSAIHWHRTLAGILLALGCALSSALGVACDVREQAHTAEVSGSDCVTCHLSDFELAESPVHVQQLPLACENCHSYEVWSPALGSDHVEFFPLRFAHAEAGCAECHSEGFDRDMLSTECVGCHLNDYQSAARPPHAGLPQTCETCHVERSFSPAQNFEHPFPLDGQHEMLACTTCHEGSPPMWQGLSSSCYDCHSDDYDMARPPHDGFSKDCTTCHTTGGWRAGAVNLPTANFVHDWWPLQGNHAVTECTGCHLGDPPVYVGTPNACVDCHMADYDGATNPSHDGFSTDCATCHSPQGWRMGTAGGPGFVHAWPLEGKHATAACSSCHLGAPPVYVGTPTECLDCHKTERDAAWIPHDSFSSNCTDCHTATAWTPAAFDHPWPLNGAHEKAECRSCHVGDPPVYAGTPTQCVDCHRDDYNRSTYPGHDTFPTDCTGCHTTTGWAPATGGVHPTNRFPISGRHNVPCMNCHNSNLGPMGKGNTDCVGCHGTEAGNHRGVNGYPTSNAPNFCLDCHPDGRE